MQLFETKLKYLEDGQCYNLQNCLLKRIKGEMFIGLTSDFVINKILAIEGLSPVTGIDDSTTADGEGFHSIRYNQLFYICPSCRKPMPQTDEKALWIKCLTMDCPTEIRVKKLVLEARCEVLFDDGGKEVWASIFPDVLTQLICKATSVQQVDDFLKSLENFIVTTRKNVVKDIKIGQDSSSKEKKS